jgi:hypothetical protein
MHEAGSAYASKPTIAQFGEIRKAPAERTLRPSYFAEASPRGSRLEGRKLRCEGVLLLLGAEGCVEYDHSYRVVIGYGEPLSHGIEGHRRRLCLPFEAPNDAAALQA